MPIYFFHTDNGDCHVDSDGTELRDLDAAKAVAVQIIAELLRGEAVAFWKTRALRMVVTDDCGLTLFRLRLSAVVEPTPGDAPATARRAVDRP